MIITILTGAMFTFPAFFVLLVKYGIIGTQMLTKNRKYLYIGLFIIINIIGSLMYTHEDFSEAIKLICDGSVNVKKLISQVIPMKNVNEAFRLIEKQWERIIKVVLIP
jgi:threonine dehydrogenase-like Zn-dependent dehydrogenase